MIKSHSINNISVISPYKNNFMVMDCDGQIQKLDKASTQNFILNTKQLILVCHKTNITKKIEAKYIKNERILDILELWAFVKPACFVVPTINEIAKSLNIKDYDPNHPTITLIQSVNELLELIKAEAGKPYLEKMIANMTKTGWPWGEILMNNLGLNKQNFQNNDINDGFDIWNRLKKWQNRPPPPNPNNIPITKEEVIARLKSLLPDNKEKRIEQFKYSTNLLDSFNPKQSQEPLITVAEGGTGVGKTIAYLAPASIWAEKNQAPVWISTYTRNLQHQIYNEISKLYKDEKELYDKVVICKGRENYVCITKFRLALKKAKIEKNWRIALGILARWLEKSIDGDITGNDFPSWLSEIIDPNNNIIKLLSVKRDVGETHSHCQYNENCFVDLALKRSSYADIVITNHAFLLFNAKFGFVSENTISRIVFDEGHHLFEASDSAFRTFLCASEAEFMRRFIIKNENGDILGSKATGLKSTITNILGNDTNAQKQVDTILNYAECLPDSKWRERIDIKNPLNTGEKFFCELKEFILNNTKASHYDVELNNSYIPNNIIETGYSFADKLQKIIAPTKQLIKLCEDKLKTQYAELDKETRREITNALKIMQFRLLDTITVWVDMLYKLDNNYENENCDYSNIIDSFLLSKINRNHNDIGIRRSYINPIKEFAKYVYPQINGAVITSASLLDSTDDENKNWDWALTRTGTNTMENPPNKIVVKSPFDYKKNSRVIVVNDIDKNNIQQLSSSYFQLFKANNGSALGLFTSIARLKQVYNNIYDEISNLNINLYAQHIDSMNTATIINIFKNEKQSCLLGTNAVRDGVDIPGESLNLLVMERIPWEITNEINKQRKKHFKNNYDKSLVRAKLKQAFGRLIRNKNDSGTFIILDNLPSDLKKSFPDDTEIINCGIDEAINLIQSYNFENKITKF